MCGIVGFYSFNKNCYIRLDTLKTMTNSMVHRGPDDNGYVLIDKEKQRAFFFGGELPNNDVVRGHIGLGHRRLSILDLSERGRQPMQDSNGRVWLTYNGEVYNYIEIRTELEKSGHTFSTGTDTEVVLASYLQWGTDCFERFNGMWGLAIYDLQKNILILSRDRFGKKPLYYYVDGNKLLFSSEIKSLFHFPGVPRKPNPQKIIDYAGRHYRYVDVDNESYFSNIYQVPKSSYMIFSARGKSFTRKYWEIRPKELFSKHDSEADIVHQFKDLFEDAVKIRLRSDVPVGTMLSGGMDSTSITAIAIQENQNVHAFSGVTGEGYYDESKYIDILVKQCGLNHTYVSPRPSELFDSLKEMMRFHDEPVCTVTWYCNYLITKEIAGHDIPVILTGHGGDELLAGYWDHYHYHLSDLRSVGGDDSYELNAWLRNHDRPKEEYWQEKKYISRMRKNHTLELNRYSKYLNCLSPRLLEQDKKRPLETVISGDLLRRQYLELLYETIPPSLRAEDRNMMAFSLENRVPLLDYRLAEFCFGLNGFFKIRNGLGKWLLREAMKGALPEKIRTRKDKAGFNAPLDEWIRKENRTRVEQLIARNSFVNNEIYDQNEVKKRFQEHLEGVNHYMFFWQYINLNLWFDMFF